MEQKRKQINNAKRQRKIFWGKFRKNFEEIILEKTYLKYSIQIWLINVILAILFSFLCLNTKQHLPMPLDLTLSVAFIAGILFEKKAYFFVPILTIIRHSIIHGLNLNLLTFGDDIIYLLEGFLVTYIVIILNKNYRKSVLYEQRFRHDIEMARIVQRTLLSKPFSIGKTKITGYIHQSMEVGGDFYYFRPFQKKYILITIGDVMGKGITASLIMSIIMSVFYEWGKKTLSPSEMFTKINKRVISLFNECRFFSTILYGVYNEETSEFNYASAGHNGVITKKDGTCEILESSGFPVGMYPNSTWTDKKIKIESGSKILLFTDGITEAQNKNGDYYTIDNVIKIAKKYNNSSGEELNKALLADISNFTKGNNEADDRAVIIMEVN